jgi:signal transduction histidine kinase
MLKTPAAAPEEQHFILSSLSPGREQKRFALAVVLALVIIYILTAGPLSTFQPGQLDAFIPTYVTAMFVVDLITAILLFSQFTILRSRALLVIASGYLFTALIVIPRAVPGVFMSNGPLAAGLQSTSSLYALWHAGFAVFVIAYALLKDEDPVKRAWRGSAGSAIVASAAMAAAVASAVTLAIIVGDARLQPAGLDSTVLSALWYYPSGAMVLFSLAALAVLWVRRRSVLDLWLMVAMCAYVIVACLISFPIPVRFSLGWYAGRVLGLLSGSLVLMVLLYEITKLYGQMLKAVLAQRREREARLMTGDAVAATIAHEVKQPLSAMIMNADVGRLWLDRTPPDLDEAKAALKQVVADGHRAGAVIDSIRAGFKSEARNRTLLNVNDLIKEALAMTRGELQRHRIVVRTEPNAQLPQIKADRIQLQQVLLNLITNASESMATKDGPRVLRIRSENDGGDVVVSVADTGPGIGPEEVERIFNPLFTTKSGGMGMGLSICRSIIEAHEGRLWVTPNKPQGAVFHFLLRAESATFAEPALQRQPSELRAGSRP